MCHKHLSVCKLSNMCCSLVACNSRFRDCEEASQLACIQVNKAILEAQSAVCLQCTQHCSRKGQIPRPGQSVKLPCVSVTHQDASLGKPGTQQGREVLCRSSCCDLAAAIGRDSRDRRTRLGRRSRLRSSPDLRAGKVGRAPPLLALCGRHPRRHWRPACRCCCVTHMIRKP